MIAFAHTGSSHFQVRLALVFWLTFLAIDYWPLGQAMGAEEVRSRFCQGFLYCEETKGDTISTQAFLYLYSTEERGTYSRLTVIPFYSREMDPARSYLRRSVLWPLGISEMKGDASYFQILPFYWHGDDPTHHYTVLIPFYFDYAKGDRHYTHYIPFYGHHRYGLTYDRYFVLGPLAIATYDKRSDLKEWDILFPLFHHETNLNGSSTRLFPIYFAGESRQDGSWYRHLLPLYGRSVTPQTDLGYLFPLYGSLTDQSRGETRTSAVGLPPIPQLNVPALALYEHISTPTTVSDRAFPLYSYSYDSTEDRSQLDVMVLFRSRISPSLTAHRLFPLYYYENDRANDRAGWAFLGYEQFSLAGYGYDAGKTWHQFVPLYQTRTDLDAQTRTTNILGIGPFSLMRYWDSLEGLGHHVFPLYRYDHSAANEWHWSALFSGPLSLYRHDVKDDTVHDRLFPLYDWRDNGSWRMLGVLGVSDWSLFYRESSPTLLTHRLFPLYRYRHDLDADEVSMDTLFLHRHHSTPTKGEDRLLLLWDAAWQRQPPGWELDLFGIKPFTWFHYESSLDRTADRLFPLYGYESTPAKGWRLSLLGFPPREESFAWSLYEQGGSPTYFLTRLFPLYRFERNDETKETNWSMLLFYRHKESDTHLLDTLPPLHEYERNDMTGKTELSLVGLKPITLFRYGTAYDARYSYFFPLYDYDREGNRSRFSLIGWPKVGALPTLSLFEKIETPSLLAHRFFPLYRYRRDDEAKTRDWDALLLWWHRETEQRLRDVFFPVADIEHDYQRDQRDVGILGIRPLTLFRYHSSLTGFSHSTVPLYSYSVKGEHRHFSAIGLPHIGEIPALTLFNWERRPTGLTHRLFPLYQYTYDQTGDVTDWNTFWLFWHHADTTQIRDTFFPLGSVRRTPSEQAWSVSALGVEPLSLIRIGGSPASTQNRFTPLWDYHTEGSEWGLSLLGIRQLSVFSHEKTAGSTTDHLFPLWFRTESQTELQNIFAPLWSTREDRQSQEQTLGLLGIGPLSLYYQQHSPAGRSARIFPAWSYQYEEATQESRTGVLGVPPISLYYGRTTPTATENRLFPLFRYTSDRVKDESELWFLWPLFDYKTAQGRTTETSFLWWLFQYRSAKADEHEYWVLGHPPIAMYMRSVTPTRTLVEVNPIIPGWRREYVEGVGTSWALFGGLIGMDAMPDGTHKLRLFWRAPEKSDMTKTQHAQ